MDTGQAMTGTARRMLIGVVALLWGAVIVLGLLSPRSPVYSGGAYGAGGKLGLAFGVLLVVLGVRFVVIAVRRARA